MPKYVLGADSRNIDHGWAAIVTSALSIRMAESRSTVQPARPASWNLTQRVESPVCRMERTARTRDLRLRHSGCLGRTDLAALAGVVRGP